MREPCALVLGELPALGAGLGYRAEFRADLFLHRPAVDFLEVIADHYLDPPPARAEELAVLADHFTLIPHGLDLSIGSADGIDDSYLDRVARLVERLHPPWWSEHLGYTRGGGRAIGQFAPLPYTEEALDVVCRNVERVRRRIDVPLILENISYTMVMPGARMSEAHFVSEVLERTGCGLLLDVMNLHANATNHDFDADAFLTAIPLEQVVQLHFVGGHWEDGVLVDSHSAPTSPEVWALLDTVLARAPVKGVILERDEHIPPVGELVEELARARESGRRHGRWR